MRPLGLAFLYLILPSLADKIIFETGDPCKDHLPHFCKCFEDAITCICNGRDINLTNRGSGRVGKVLVQDCGTVEVSPRAFENTGVQFTAVNVGQLVLHKHSFLVANQTAAVSCSLTNTTVQLIPSDTFAQRDRPSPTSSETSNPKFSLKIEKSNIGLIERHAMQDLSVENLELQESSFNDTRLYAFDINLSGNLTIVDSSFMYIQRNAFTFQGQNPESVFRLHGNDFQGPVSKAFVGDFKGHTNISDNAFSRLRSSPFVLWTEGLVDIRNNTFDIVTDLGLNVTGMSRITLAYNTFKDLKPYAFKSLYAKDPEATLFFDNNHIYNYYLASLQLHTGLQSDAVVIKGNVFERECSCNITQDITYGIGLQEQTYQDLLRDKIYSQWFHQNDCLYEGDEVLMVDKYITKYCTHRTSTTFLVVFAVILILIAVGVIVAWRRIRHGSTTAQNLNSSSASGPYSTVSMGSHIHPYD
ncbi:uncharacterized protein LOC143039596 [Oratosquilla oratoria]|uniref:uncharacterized protein LOC143039596 n=1 Tax=Oratosquilla oratoria TaxID=337810 RepID=UPI003F766BE3